MQSASAEVQSLVEILQSAAAGLQWISQVLRTLTVAAKPTLISEPLRLRPQQARCGAPGSVHPADTMDTALDKDPEAAAEESARRRRNKDRCLDRMRDYSVADEVLDGACTGWPDHEISLLRGASVGLKSATAKVLPLHTYAN